MKRVRLGDIIQFENAIWQVTAQHGAGLTLRHLDNGSERMVAVKDLFADQDFDLETTPPPIPIGDVAVLERLSPQARESVTFLHRHVVEVITGRLPQDGVTPPAPSRPEYDITLTLESRVASKVDELAIHGIRMSARTIQRHIAAYRREGMGGLVDRRQTKPRSAAGRIHPEVVRLLESEMARNELGLKSQIIAAVSAEASTRALPLPSRATLYRALTSMTATSRGNKTEVRRASNSVNRPVPPAGHYEVGQIVEIRAGNLGVELVQPDGTLQAACVVVMMDRATRTVCSTLLKIGSIKVDGALLLARSLLPLTQQPGWTDSWSHLGSVLRESPKEYESQLRELDALTPTILPQKLVVGLRHVVLDSRFQNACERLETSFEIQNSDARDPSFDQLFGKLTSALNKAQLSYTQSKHLTIEIAQEVIDQWIISFWQHASELDLHHPALPHQRLSPTQMYGATLGIGSLPSSPLDLDGYLNLLPQAWRRIHHYGVNLRARQYDSTELKEYRKIDSGLSGPAANRWEFRFDPYRPHVVWFHDHLNRRWIKCFATT